jgi:hypothetical protein
MDIGALFRRSRPPTDPQVLAVRLGAVALTATLLALCAPIIWSAVSAGAGLAFLAVLAGLGLAVFQALPLALQILENRLLKLRKWAAASNPIEQLQNEILKREQRLIAFRGALSAIGGQIESMAQMVEERQHADPGHVLDRQTRALQRMAQFHAANVQRLDEAQGALDAFRQQVRQKMFEWEFAQSGEAVMAALNPSELHDLMQDLLTDTALQSVQKRFNQVFAELDVELRAVGAPTRPILETTRLERLGALGTPSSTGKGRSS